jgi:hypothetical protein
MSVFLVYARLSDLMALVIDICASRILRNEKSDPSVKFFSKITYTGAYMNNAAYWTTYIEAV